MAKHCEQLEILKNVRPFFNMMHERLINVMDGKKRLILRIQFTDFLHFFLSLILHHECTEIVGVWLVEG